jgi:hypothetical protein
MEVRDLVEEILPRTKIILLNHETDLKAKIHEWLSKKGFLVRFVGKNLVDPIWQLVIGPLLPIIVEKSILIILGIVAPQLAPFVPLLLKLMEYVNMSLTVEEKEFVRQFLVMTQSFKSDDEIKEIINLDPWKVVGALNSQEYFDGKP